MSLFNQKHAHLSRLLMFVVWNRVRNIVLVTWMQLFRGAFWDFLRELFFNEY